MGYMPDSKPHSVNNMIVADLGEKELLLCACDDGDVLGFWTDTIETMVSELEIQTTTARNDLESSLREVQRTVHKARNDGDESVVDVQPKATQPSAEEEDRPFSDEFAVDCVYLRTFFHAHVGFSAWGLAVHTDLRLIAVSSNSQKVHVFAHALTSSENAVSSPKNELDDGTVSDDEVEEWALLPQGHYSLLERRSSNRYRVLLGHTTNIPTIAFDNSSSTHGRLVSADISGHVIIWHVDTGEPIHELFEGTPHPLDLDLWTAGWGVMCLDRRAFRKASGIVDALGVCTTTIKRGVRSSSEEIYVVDTSSSRLIVPNTGVWEPGNVSQNTGHPAERDSESFLDGSADPEEESEAEDPDLMDEQQMLEISPSNVKHLLRSNKAGEYSTYAVDRGVTREYAISHELSPMLTSDAFACPISPPLPALDTPIMILHPQAIHLLQSSDLISRTSKSPVIFLKDPLYQLTSDDALTRFMHRQDRMNLYCQIPEIGIVLVGSPKGRVAVLTLWQLERNPFDTASKSMGDKGYNFLKKNIPSSPICTFRLDHLLPLKQQEEADLRPLQQLVGLCASPLQGCGGTTREARRGCSNWRVLMMYRDHTILAYELSRQPGAALDVVSMT